MDAPMLRPPVRRRQFSALPGRAAPRPVSPC